MAIIDWDKIKNEYISTKISIKKLSDKYNIKLSTIQMRSTNGKWTQLKKNINKKKDKKAIKKIIDNLAEKQANAIIKHFDVSNILLKEINKTLSNKKELYTYVEKLRNGGEGWFEDKLEEIIHNSINDKKVLNLVNSLEKLQKMQRQSLDIMDMKDKKNIEIQEKKIDSDKNLEDLKESIKNWLDATRPSKQEIIDTFSEKIDEED
jgi:hypothetical protein